MCIKKKYLQNCTFTFTSEIDAKSIFARSEFAHFYKHKAPEHENQKAKTKYKIKLQF